MTTTPFDAFQPTSQHIGPDHIAFRDMLRRFVDSEIAPFVDQWDEAGEFPRALYKKAAEIGLIGVTAPEAYGGSGGDLFMEIIALEELARAGSGGVIASLLSHGIALPPILSFASEELKQRVVPDVLAGRKIAALAVTEPDGGSDVAAIRTRAVRDGKHYVVNGSKAYITSGLRADYYTVAVRTGGDGADGLSLLLIERDREGFSRSELKKMGWWSSDTAMLYFDDVRVPADNLIGQENTGFMAIMHNFNHERLMLAAQANAFAKVCLEEAVNYARERIVFSKPLITRQVIRHKLVDMATAIHATRAWLDELAARITAGESPVDEIAMLKNQATRTLDFCAREAVQILGGAGYMRGTKVERIYREVRVLAIGGGAEEIMADLAARQMGL